MATRPLVVAVAAIALSLAAWTSLPTQTPPPASVPAAATRPDPATRPDLAALGVLAGTWQGEVEGSFVEEIWSTPQGNTIMGCFRWCDERKNPAMLEMLMITSEADAIRLRLRHYTPTLGAKEEKDAPVTLKLARAEGTRFRFEAEKHTGDVRSVTYEVTGASLHIEVAFAETTAANGTKETREPLRFSLKRV